MSQYSDLIGAINGLYEKKDDILVVDFHQHSDFHADVSLPHTVTTLASPTPFDIFWNSSYLALKHERRHVGLFNTVNEKQPHWSCFIGKLFLFWSLRRLLQRVHEPSNIWHALLYYNPTCGRYMVINCYLGVIMLRHCCDFLVNPAVTSQSYNVLAMLYLLCITKRILYLIDDITIILHVADTRFIWVL